MRAVESGHLVVSSREEEGAPHDNVQQFLRHHGCLVGAQIVPEVLPEFSCRRLTLRNETRKPLQASLRNRGLPSAFSGCSGARLETAA